MSAGGQRQRGIAAIELALILTFALAILPSMVLLGRVLWHYTVLQKAVHDAARYLASVPPVQMSNPAAAAAAVALAQNMVVDAAAAADMPSLAPAAVTVLCDGHACGFVAALPATVQVSVILGVDDPVYGVIAQDLLGTASFVLSPMAMLRYGN